MELTYQNLHNVMEDCLYRPTEISGAAENENAVPAGAVCAEGVLHNFCFHPQRLESHRQDVKSMLSNMEDAFMVEKGGGMSLIRMPFTKDGKQFGEQIDAECLYVLGNALGYCKFCLPREMWDILPGGMPYVQIDLSK